MDNCSDECIADKLPQCQEEDQSCAYQCHPVQDTTALLDDLFASTKTCMIMDDPFSVERDMKELYISSSDSLRNRRIIQTIPQGWNDRPPLFVGKDQDGLLKGVSLHETQDTVVSFLLH